MDIVRENMERFVFSKEWTQPKALWVLMFDDVAVEDAPRLLGSIFIMIVG